MTLTAYTDGSYDKRTKQYGYGVYLVEPNIKLSGSGIDEYGAWNVTGEIEGVKEAIEYSIEHKYDKIIIHHDYIGLSKWANNEWKTNKDISINYKNFIKDKRQKIQIDFIKVKAHSNDTYNDIADSLAKGAIL